MPSETYSTFNYVRLINISVKVPLLQFLKPGINLETLALDDSLDTNIPKFTLLKLSAVL